MLVTAKQTPLRDEGFASGKVHTTYVTTHHVFRQFAGRRRAVIAHTGVLPPTLEEYVGNQQQYDYK